MKDFDRVNTVYAKFFTEKELLPARACVAVTELPMGCFFEIIAECVCEPTDGEFDKCE